MKTTHSRSSTTAGYTLVEAMFVAGIVSVLGSIAVPQIGTARRALVSDGALRVVLGQVNQAREMAITQRRYMRLVFSGTNTVQIVREDTVNTTSQVASVPLEGGMQFALVSGVADTPDQFGKSSAVAFGNVTSVKFKPDGTFVDQDGHSVNGSVFLSMPNLPATARALTVMGSTGRIRAYKWNGSAWAQR